MKILVTAGSTFSPIDKVRGITNIFGGRTGTEIAHYFSWQDNDVTLITSNRDLTNSIRYMHLANPDTNFRLVDFHTFNELKAVMEQEIVDGGYDVIIHSAAVSDYRVEEICVQDKFGRLVPINSSTKVSSRHQELYLKMVQTEKLIDNIRFPWGFSGKLVKFKLEVGIFDENLLVIAGKSRYDSRADLMVANCLEWSREYAYVIDSDDQAVKVSRDELPKELLRRLK